METIHKTLLSKPNMKKLLSLYRSVLKTNKVLPFTLLSLCNEAATSDFRNARAYYNNSQFIHFYERWTTYQSEVMDCIMKTGFKKSAIMDGGGTDLDQKVYSLLG